MVKLVNNSFAGITTEAGTTAFVVFELLRVTVSGVLGEGASAGRETCEVIVPFSGTKVASGVSVRPGSCGTVN